jgi:hypothetical protein
MRQFAYQKQLMQTGKLIINQNVTYLPAFFFIWFVRLLALRPLLAYCAAASGDSEDDCGEAGGM